MRIKILSLILLLFSLIDCKGKMRDISTMKLTREMGVGINLGNTFESFGDWIEKYGDGSPKSYYTAWGSPEVTYDLISGYYKEGFRVLRIPVHWFNLMDDEYNISKEYMEEVRIAVDDALDVGLYVILNIHHDERGLFSGFAKDKKTSMTRYLKIWTQIAEEFKDYDDHLMFEALNEEACWGDLYNRWGPEEERLAGQKIALSLVSEINQQFVRLIRNSGGNNNLRHLLISGYCTDITESVSPLFRLPYDPVNRFAVSLHYYTPSTFAILTEDADWGKVKTEWGSPEDLRELENNFDLVKETFIDKGIPVIIGEYGCPKGKDKNSVHDYIYNVAKNAYDRHMVPVLWDTPGGFYNRTTFEFDDIILRDKIMSVVSSE